MDRLGIEVMEKRVRDFFEAVERAGDTADKVSLELARKGHKVGAPAIRGWFRHESQPKLEVIFLLAQIYDISLDAYALREPLEARFTDQLADHEHRISLLDARLRRLASMQGLGEELERAVPGIEHEAERGAEGD
jgi:transcriptional regulator with XRE-family HTH domain